MQVRYEPIFSCGYPALHHDRINKISPLKTQNGHSGLNDNLHRAYLSGSAPHRAEVSARHICAVMNRRLPPRHIYTSSHYRSAVAAYDMFTRCTRISCQSSILPSVEIVTTCHGINFPLFCNAVFAACSKPPQHGTSILTTVTLLMSFLRIISVSFSE